MKSQPWFWGLTKLLAVVSVIISGCQVGVSMWTLVNSFRFLKLNKQVSIDLMEAKTGQTYSQHYCFSLRLCLIVSTVFCLTQVISALRILFSFTKKINERIKRWLVLNWITFALLLICFWLPLAIHKNGESEDMVDMIKSLSSTFNLDFHRILDFQMNVQIYLLTCFVNLAYTFPLSSFLTLVLGSGCGFERYENV